MGPSRPRDSTRTRKAHPPEKLSKKLAIPKPSKSRTIRGRLGDDLPDRIPAEVEIAIHEERGSLIVVISLLYGLHSILRRQLEGDESEVSEAVEHAAKWADFTKLSEMLLVKLHAVLENLDNIASGVTNVDPEDVAMAETARESWRGQGSAE